MLLFLEELIKLVTTVVSGVAVFIAGQHYIEFTLRPIQQYKALKGEVAKILVYYAGYYTSPFVLDGSSNLHSEDYEKKLKIWADGAIEMRKMASEVYAFAEIRPEGKKAKKYIPIKEDLDKAASRLIGISNSFIVSQRREDAFASGVPEWIDEIKKLMKIGAAW